MMIEISENWCSNLKILLVLYVVLQICIWFDTVMIEIIRNLFEVKTWRNYVCFRYFSTKSDIFNRNKFEV